MTQGKVLGQNGGMKSCVISFNANPSEAIIIVKDREGNIIEGNNNIYKLKAGIYSYSATCEGYFPLEEQELLVLEDRVINVILNKKLYVEFNLFPTTATLVVKDGNGNELVPEENNIYLVTAGVYSYTVSARGYISVENIPFTMIDSEVEKNIDVVLESPKYGIKRQISSAGTNWERILNNAGLTAVAQNGAETVHNDFDNIYPWSDIKTCDISADGTINKYIGDPGFSFTNPTGYIMTEVPEFWWKREQKDGYEYIYISPGESEGFTKSERFYIGRYFAGGSASALTSKSGVTPATSITLPNFRTAAKRIGSNWGQLDILRWSLLQMLYLVEYADYNSQNKLGFGICNGSVNNSGGCDTLGMKSGTLNNNKQNAVIYRGIENIFGNLYQWCDGVNFTNSQAWISENPNDYVSDRFSSPYTRLGYVCPSNNGYIKEVGYDSNNPAIQLPKIIGGSDSSYIPDCAYYGTGSRVLMVGGGCSGGLNCGLWYYDWNYASSDASGNIGGRLLFTPA